MWWRSLGEGYQTWELYKILLHCYIAKLLEFSYLQNGNSSKDQLVPKWNILMIR